MTSHMAIDPAKQGFMDTIALNGAENASQALSRWFGRSVQITTGGFRVVPLEDLAELMCGSEEVIVLRGGGRLGPSRGRRL